MFTPFQFGLGVSSAALAGVLGAVAVMTWIESDDADKNTGGSAITLEGDPNADPSGSHSPGKEMNIYDPGISFRQLERIAEAGALRDPEKAIASGMQIPGTDNREAYLSSVLRTWGETDGEAAATWSRDNLKGESLSDALYYVSDGWAESDPEAAAEWFVGNTEGVILDDAAWEILESWGRKDPEAAFQWSENLDPYVKQSVMDGLAEGWAAVAPEEAKEAGMKMLEEESVYAHEFLVSVATQWSGQAPSAAAEWGEAILNEAVREGVLSEVGEVWAQSDPHAAAEWLKDVSDPGSRRFAQEGVLSGWAGHDPGGAIDWLLGESGGQRETEELVGRVVSDWTDIDPRGMVQWLDSRTPGRERDLVLGAFSEAVFEGNPQAAIAWANEIGDASSRSRYLETLIQRWVQIEGDPALEAIEKMNIPPEFKPDNVSTGN